MYPFPPYKEDNRVCQILYVKKAVQKKGRNPLEQDFPLKYFKIDLLLQILHIYCEIYLVLPREKQWNKKHKQNVKNTKH